jgi:2'-5' RNA ligase
MARRNEHLVVIMLEPMPADKEFESWPLHITLVPWFPCDNESKLDSTLAKIAARHEAFIVAVDKKEDWGREDKFSVITIADEEDLLHKLHLDVFDTLENSNFPIHQKDFLGDKYRPHITLRNYLTKDYPFKTGEEVIIDRFTLIKQHRFRGSGRMIKAVVKDYKLQ